MTSDVTEGLKVPTRPAPPPPKVDYANGIVKRSTTISFGLSKPPEKPSTRADKYIYQSVPRSRSTSDIAGERKKLPPPRPPPPKLPPITAVTNFQKPQSIKIKLPGFKSRKSKHQYSKPHIHVSSWQASTNTNKSHPLVGSLIDLQSPPLSPSTNNGSSSDDSSVDSFDSDSGGPSSTENQNDYTRAWSSSQVESGFEDDFDRLSTPSSSDPWSDSKPDPFSPQRVKIPLSGKFDISNEDPKVKKSIKSSSPAYVKPTVIRPAIPINIRRPLSLQNKDEDSVDGSPPMPSVPPPPPPPEALEVLAHGPPIPPRPNKKFEPPASKTEKPYCVALYDYSTEQIEDLSFKENDKIFLKRSVNEEWLEGEINGKTGIFPMCFVRVVVPLPNKDDTGYRESTMITLFDYHAQSWDDLELKEGALIRVIGEVDDNWLYGEYNGKEGQFPSNYVAEYVLN